MVGEGEEARHSITTTVHPRFRHLSDFHNNYNSAVEHHNSIIEELIGMDPMEHQFLDHITNDAR